MNQDENILVLEGAKQEAAYYLRNLLRQEQVIKQYEAKRSRMKKRPRKGVFKHNKWVDALVSDIEALKARHLPVYVLEWFLENRANATDDFLSDKILEKCVASFHDVDQEQETLPQHYSSLLESLSSRRSVGQGIRNESDAMNLALLREVNDRNRQKRWRMVTGTKILRKMRPSDTISPISFAIDVALRDHFPDPSQREVYLTECNGNLLSFLAELNVHIQAVKGSPRDVTRQDVAAIDRLLIDKSMEKLQLDPTLGLLLRIMATASVSAQNEFETLETEIGSMAEELLVSPEGQVSSLNALVASVENILANLQQDGQSVSAGGLGLEWDTRATEVGLAKQWRLWEKRSERAVITLDAYDDCHVVCWNSRVSIGGFIKAVDELLEGTPIRISRSRIVFYDKPSIDVPMHGKLTLANILRASDGEGRIARIALFSKNRDFYYEIPRIDRGTFTRVLLSEDENEEFGFNSQAEIAVISDSPDYRMIEELQAKTFYDYLPIGFLSSEIKTMLSRIDS